MSPRKLDEKKYHTSTRLIYGQSHSLDWDYGHHVVPPMTGSSTFRLDSAERGAQGFQALGKGPETSVDGEIFVYGRMGEPTTDMLQHALAVAEGGEIAFAFGSGMAAIHAAIFFGLNPGSEIISHQTIYGCTYSLFTNLAARSGFKTHFCNLTNAESFLPYVNDDTRLLFIESPANPTLELTDLDHIVGLLSALNATRPPERRIISVIDNTIATPWCQRPLLHGIDVVAHSLTKGIIGFGTELGGAVITRKEFFEPLFSMRKDCGGMMSSYTAWHILNYGLPSLALRAPKQQENAMVVADYLEQHDKVAKVYYPGLKNCPQAEVAQRMLRDYDNNFAPGSMLFFTLKGSSPEDAKVRGNMLMNYLADNSYTITLAVSLGQIRTLVQHPASMTHAAYPLEEQIRRGIDPGGIRLSLGIENVHDIIHDLEEALAQLS